MPTSADPGVPAALPAPLRPYFRVARQAWRAWNRDHCTQAASSLAFQTALALVPLLAVAFALLKAFHQLQASSDLLNFVGQLLLPSSPEARAEIVQRLASFSDNVAAGALGSMGLVATIVVSFLLFLNVESFWNAVWASPRQRPFVNRFLLFYAAITLVPFLLAVSLGYLASLGHWGLMSIVLSWLSTLLLFVVGNKIMPVAQVQWGAALRGGLVSTVFFELAKVGFSLYLARVIGSYRSIYGALGLLPIFFVWIYLCWLILLWGVEIAHAAQRLEALEATERREDRDGSLVVVSGALALHLCAAVARHFAAGQGALGAAAIAGRYGLSEAAVALLMERLREHGLVLPHNEGYLPGRPADRIRADEVLAAFQAPLPAQAEDEGLARFLREVEAHAAELARARTVADLIGG